MDPNLVYTVVFLLASVAYYYVLLGNRGGKTAKKIKTPPYPSRPLPLIGHLHVLFSGPPFHHLLADIADKHEPTFSLRFGTKLNVVILSRWEEAKEFFTVNDKVMISRPVNSIGLHLGYNYAMFGTSPYGDYWNSIRRITMQELLSSRRADLLQDMYESEIRASMKDLYRRAIRDCGPLRKGLVDFRRWCKHVMMDVLLRLMVGKSGFSYSGEYSESRVEELVTAVNKFVSLSNVHPSDVIGPLRWCDIQGTRRRMRETNRELDGFLSEWLKEHRRMRNSGQVKPDEMEDLMGILLSLADKGQLPNHYDVDTCIKANFLEIFLNGVETTSATLMWSISSILRNPHVLEKVREELDRVVGCDRWIDESDTSKIPYLWAVIKESMRLDPATPLLAPREAIEDCTIGGYDVPKGTMLLVNAWKVMRDPRVWPEPLEFRPERFLESESQLDVRGQHFNLIPFSSGRRSCPGTTFALRMLPLIIGGIIQGFDLTVPSDKPIDDTENPTLNSTRAHPLEIQVTPRLRADLYA